MIKHTPDARPTTSAAFDEDRQRGEIESIVGILISPETGIWILAKVNPNPDPRFSDDLFRAYPETTFSNRTGLVCLTGTSRKHVADGARRWS
jgi:hypothetical protein